MPCPVLHNYEVLVAAVELDFHCKEEIATVQGHKGNADGNKPPAFTIMRHLLTLPPAYVLDKRNFFGIGDAPTVWIFLSGLLCCPKSHSIAIP
jgi:hypothetical protein